MRQRRVLLAILAISTLACATAFLALAEALAPSSASLSVAALLALLASGALLSGLALAILLFRPITNPTHVLRATLLAALLLTTALVLRSRELFDLWTFLPLVLASLILEFAARTRRPIPTEA